MKTLKKYTDNFLLFIHLKSKPKTVSEYITELTNPRFKMDFKNVSANNKKIISLLSQMYSEENDALFI